jgi:hypothetical protein
MKCVVLLNVFIAKRNKKEVFCMTYVFSDYIKYKAASRGFELEQIEQILRYSEERYFDTATHRMIAVGKHDNRLVMIPYETDVDTIMPVTIHATTRQQIKFRLKTGRFIHE